MIDKYYSICLDEKYGLIMAFAARTRWVAIAKGSRSSRRVSRVASQCCRVAELCFSQLPGTARG